MAVVISKNFGGLKPPPDYSLVLSPSTSCGMSDLLTLMPCALRLQQECTACTMRLINLTNTHSLMQEGHKVPTDYCKPQTEQHKTRAMLKTTTVKFKSTWTQIMWTQISIQCTQIVPAGSSC